MQATYISSFVEISHFLLGFLSGNVFVCFFSTGDIDLDPSNPIYDPKLFSMQATYALSFIEISQSLLKLLSGNQRLMPPTHRQNDIRHSNNQGFENLLN